MASVKAGSSSISIVPTVPKETDYKIRWAHIYLYAVHRYFENKPYSQCILVFQFEDSLLNNSVRTIQGVIHKNKVKPHYDCVIDSEWQKVSSLGKKLLSPQYVRLLALRNPWNHQVFQLGYNDSEIWIQAIFNQLGLKQETSIISQLLVPTILSSSGGIVPTVRAETDQRKRNANIFLYHSEALGMKFQNKIYKHWILVFDFQHGNIRFLEGLRYSGQLRPNYGSVIQSNWKKDSYLGTKLLSPVDVRNLALTNPLNNTPYKCLEGNSQDWANAVLKKLNFSQELTMASELFWTSMAATTAVINPVAGISVYAGRQLYNTVYNSVKNILN